ncbi:MAG: ribosome biogenesis GTPase [Candidatus Azotimanducaceae bacterium]
MGVLSELESYGWKPVFQQQALQLDAEQKLTPVRVVEVHRSGLRVAPPLQEHAELPLAGRWFQLPVEGRPTVGDWVLVDAATGAVEHLMTRTSEIKRLSPAGELQMIAANIDTGFVVTSANTDFSLERTERYLTVLVEADIQPVVVITKSDLAEDGMQYVTAIHATHPDVPVELVNALELDSLAGLVAWIGKGQSIALLGSSGVGKSTLVNTMLGSTVLHTQSVRDGDDKGRHTTTHRSLHRLPSGGVILDSPGMREFQITDADRGVSSVFADIESLALTCRFNDCAHNTEPGCAIQAALASGELELRRLKNFFKLKREERVNTETVAERHVRARQFSRQVKNHIAQKPKLKR